MAHKVAQAANRWTMCAWSTAQSRPPSARPLGRTRFLGWPQTCAGGFEFARAGILGPPPRPRPGHRCLRTATRLLADRGSPLQEAAAARGKAADALSRLPRVSQPI